ncbi:Apolipoprotein D [Pseudolycoriella hygida]|uniref:Apolipoprotein D n=1 Tax=Pseudolycoriella hygida TaxID=35572 RepID=A0A9Q0MRY7_9DIPT|nr:Apolipoprotein D [Pseudolycoriella hygida]
MKVIFFLFVIVFVKIDARVFVGKCRKIPAPVVEHFEFKNYMGVWYEILWYDDEYETFDECLQFTYEDTSTCDSEKTFKTQLKLQSPTDNYEEQQKYYGVGKQFDGGKLGTGTIYPTAPNYFVLATDYCNYSFVWDCFNVNATHYNERMWYFDRQPNPSSIPRKVQSLISKHFDKRYVRKTYHGDKCRY